jgi:REP element-mobilizing transposase RayT
MRAYFVTICTHARALLFDDARFAHELELAWRSIGRYTRARPDTLVVMPKHVHGIIWLIPATPATARHIAATP